MTGPSIQVSPISGPHLVAEAGAVLDAAARALADCARDRIPDLAHARVLLPNLHAAAEFKRCLLRRCGAPSLILPRISTYGALAEDGDSEIHDTARAAWLYGALRNRGWFDDASRWGISRELGALFDELTARNLALPRDLEEFRTQLKQAYGGSGERGIDFEAKLVGELWFALESAGEASPAARRKLRLAKLAAAPAGPLIAVLCEPASPEQQAFFSAWSLRHPVSVIQFAPQAAAPSTLTGFLNQVWPPVARADAENVHPTPPLLERAAGIKREFAVSPLAGKVSLVGTASGEQEANAAVLSIRSWLAAGAHSIAVVTQDRLVARRLRALLEREQILVSDEAGWKLSTTSAGTVVARWLDCVADGFYHRDLLDLLKSPFALYDIGVEPRREQVHRLEQLIRRDNIIEGLDPLAGVLVREPASAPVLAIVRRLQQAARAQMPRPQERKAGVPLGAWLARLDDALQMLGVTAGLEHDAAGRQLLELLRARREALADDRQAFAFHEWRGWLNGEFEAATFRDTEIASPVVFTQLASSRLRRFDRVLLLGADALHLPGAPAAPRFFNQRVRAALGLPTAEDEAETLRSELLSLVSLAGEVRMSWQAQINGEPNPPAALIDVLQAVHARAFDDALRAPELLHWLRLPPAAGEGVADKLPHRAPRPRGPGLVPQRVSSSAYASLVDCPYQFFARYMLRLNETDEVLEQIAKRDFGEAVHRVLKAFHEQVAVAREHEREASLRLLEQLGEREFAPLVRRNPLAAAYQAEWRAMASNYLDWQSRRELDGWRFQAAEVRRELSLGVAGAGAITFTGRLDRVDVNAEGSHAVLDYKTRAREVLAKEAAAPDEHVQLASYALLQRGEGARSVAPAEVGFVALERKRVSDVLQAGDIAELADKTAARLEQTFAAIHAGAEMPAQGVEAVCAYCEMRGLCRRDYWEQE